MAKNFAERSTVLTGSFFASLPDQFKGASGAYNTSSK
jgi:hypothetical protein